MGKETWGTGARTSAVSQERVEWQLNQIREGLSTSGGGVTEAQIVTAIEAADNLAALATNLATVKDELTNSNVTGDGVSTVMGLLYNTQTVLEVGLDGIFQELVNIKDAIGFPSAQYEQTVLNIAIGQSTTELAFNQFANCNCSFAVSGLGVAETATLVIQQKASPNAPFIDMTPATFTGSGNHTITFRGFPAMELRLKLASATNPAAQVNTVWWRFGR